MRLATGGATVRSVQVCSRSGGDDRGGRLWRWLGADADDEPAPVADAGGHGPWANPPRTGQRGGSSLKESTIWFTCGSTAFGSEPAWVNTVMP